MSRHIICTFQCMLVLRSVLWHKSIEDSLHIYSHIRVCILIDAQAATRMLAEYIDNARFWQLGQLTQYLAGHQMEPARLGL